MPTADSASMSPITFAPASEAPVDPNRLCLVAPADEDWILAHLTEDGWFSADGGRIDVKLRLSAARSGKPASVEKTLAMTSAAMLFATKETAPGCNPGDR